MPVLALLGMIMISLLGLADASFLTYEKLVNATPNCNVASWLDCGTVLNSRWSSVGPIPLSALGMGFYAVMFILAATLLLRKQQPAWLVKLVSLLALWGFGFSLFLTGVQAFELRVFCFFCLVSALTSTSLAGVTALGLFFARKRKAAESDKSEV